MESGNEARCLANYNHLQGVYSGIIFHPWTGNEAREYVINVLSLSRSQTPSPWVESVVLHISKLRMYLSLCHVSKAIIHLSKDRHEVMIVGEGTAARIQFLDKIVPLPFNHLLPLCIFVYVCMCVCIFV